MLEIMEAKYIEDYTIYVAFNDGKNGIVDLSQAFWGPMFEPLKDPAEFRKMKVSDVLHTICWENDADLAPEYVYERMMEQSAVQDMESLISTDAGEYAR